MKVLPLISYSLASQLHFWLFTSCQSDSRSNDLHVLSWNREKEKDNDCVTECGNVQLINIKKMQGIYISLTPGAPHPENQLNTRHVHGYTVVRLTMKRNGFWMVPSIGILCASHRHRNQSEKALQLFFIPQEQQLSQKCHRKVGNVSLCVCL